MSDVKCLGKVSVVTVLGATMLLAGIYYFVMQLLVFSIEFDRLLATVSYALIAGVGLWIIVHRDMGMREGVYLCGLTMGISIVLQNIMFMYLDSDDVTFFLELGSLVLGILLIFFAAGFLFGYDISSTRLTVTVAIQILVIIAPMFIDWFIKVVPTLTVIGEYYVQFPLLILFGVYGFILTRDGIRYPSVKERIEDNLESIENMFHSDSDMYMTGADADAIQDVGGWQAVDSGPVESEMKVDLHGDSPMVLLVQRMRCDEILHAVVLDGPKNSFIQGFRFDIVQTVRSEDSITFYGRKGVFVRICIGEVPVKKDRRPAFMNGCGSAK